MFSELAKLNNKDVHNFSLGCLCGYFRLIEAVEKGKVFFNGRVLHLNMYGAKTYVFLYQSCDQVLLKQFQKKGPVYSLSSIPLTKETTFKELVYDLDNIFNPDSYPNAKKRYQKIRYPFTWLKKQEAEIELLSSANFEEVEALYTVWVRWKLQDKKTYKIMFPDKRYINCCKKALEIKPRISSMLSQKPLLIVNYPSFVLRIKEKIEAVRVVSFQGTTAYDLAFFGNTWSAPSQMMNYFDVYVLKKLHEQGIKLFNCGAGLNKHLTQFKSHYPSHAIISYKYSKEKK
jgi:hypothetical protein